MTIFIKGGKFMEDLRLELFDAIAKAKESMDIASIKYETDVIYDMLKEVNDLENNTNKEMLLKSDIYIAMASYYVNPKFNLKERIPIIMGMRFHSTMFATNRQILESKSPTDQIAFCIEQLNMKNFDLSLEYEHYFRLGIAISANLNDKSKHK